LFNNKNILITGGTGSFGRCCVNTILNRFQPNRLIVFSRDELKQFEMQQEVNAPCMRYFLGDVRDRTRLSEALSGVDYVIHAAALKQVEAAEYNPIECIKTNIHGAENVINASIERSVEKVMALSTDKAVNPINLYGATKLASDKLFVAANNTVGGRVTRFSVVRYGNVVASRGSVVQIFKDLERKEARSIPLTHQDMTRFWITIQQGVDFVLNSFARIRGGEILTPKMPSVRITDVAEAYAPGIPIEIIGVRPGEKLHEIICPRDDSHLTLEFSQYYLIKPAIKMLDESVSYESSIGGETGNSVASDFEYASGDNQEFLTVEKIRAYDV
jgi:UDP-N-acetylglucosamine 4,6-dehydratase/5-epimerase